MFLSILKMVKKAGVILFFLSIFLIISASVLNFKLLFEGQEAACLPFTIALLNEHHIEKFNVGDIVAFKLNNGQMGKDFDNKNMVKMIAAVPGDKITVADGVLKINDKVFGPLDIVKSASKFLKRDEASFNREEVVPEGKLFMVGTLPRTFDSRYWGAVDQSSVIGSIYPIY